MFFSSDEELFVFYDNVYVVDQARERYTNDRREKNAEYSVSVVLCCAASFLIQYISTSILAGIAF